MRTIFKCLLITVALFAWTEAEFAAAGSDGAIKEPNQYGIVYYLDFENNEPKRSNEVEDDGLRDFKKVPDNGLLIIRLLPKSALKGTILENVQDDDVTRERQKRSPGGCSKCGGGGGGPGGGYGGGGGPGGGGGHGGGGGGGNGGGGGFGVGPGGGGGHGGGPGGGGGFGGGPGGGGGYGGGPGGGGGGGGGKTGAWSSSSSGAYSKGY